MYVFVCDLKLDVIKTWNFKFLLKGRASEYLPSFVLFQLGQFFCQQDYLVNLTLKSLAVNQGTSSLLSLCGVQPSQKSEEFPTCRAESDQCLPKVCVSSRPLSLLKCPRYSVLWHQLPSYVMHIWQMRCWASWIAVLILKKRIYHLSLHPLRGAMRRGEDRNRGWEKPRMESDWPTEKPPPIEPGR